jgi:lipopolysaccharide/colanic/teichoic acid biosynthesis glycosyltransferase
MQNAQPAGMPRRSHRNGSRGRHQDSGFWERNGGFKRAFDIVASLSACLFLIPVLAVIAIAVRLSSKGPLIYKQQRSGRDGEVFQMYKFRTMYIDSDNVLDALLRSCPRSAQEWRTFQKLRYDPRITPVGAILRKTSLDELPQLFNVLFGHMSMVGQRPILPAQIDAYGAEHYAEYMRARPGITGLWQVSGRNGLSFEKRAALGTEYSKNWSNRYDLKLLLKTVPALLKSDDAF